MIKLLGFIAGLVIGFVVPFILAGYLVGLLQVTGLVWYSWYVLFFLLLSALIRWSLDVITNVDMEGE